MKKSGRILLSADVAKEYNIRDIDGELCHISVVIWKGGHFV